MEKLVARLDANAFDGAYVTLVADVPELYAKFGFESVRPESEGWPASGEPAVVSSHFLPGKERCPNGNSSCGAFLTMLNAIHIARIP